MGLGAGDLRLRVFKIDLRLCIRQLLAFGDVAEDTEDKNLDNLEVDRDKY